VLLLLPLSLSARPGDGPARYILDALAAPDRPETDKARDAGRKPAEVLNFFGIQPGDRVVELMAGSGYYVDILSRVVGEKGKVYAQNNAFVLKRFAEKPLSKRLSNPVLANVVRHDKELDDPDLPSGLDAVLIILFYHDTYWQGVDREKMNKAVFASLKPGAIFGVVDHHAEAGSGARDVETIHRMDMELLKKEILAAGFELAAESDVLRHPEDDRTVNVFKMRGKTDRFVLKFRKPN